MVVKPTDLNTLVAAARAIAHGRVVDVRTQSSDRTSIQTLVTVEVSSYLKGDLGRIVTFVVPGGTLGRYRAVASGAPHFAAGEEVVLFLGARAPALPYLVRLSEGVFRVRRDDRSGLSTLTRRPLVGRSQDWRPVARGGAEGSMTLDAFSTLVRSAVEAAR